MSTPYAPAKLIVSGPPAAWHREAIRSAFPSLMSLLVGCLGGCVTMWIAARRKEASE
jgi:hypothetical protein